jgi:predicted aspartyl protease
MRAGCSRRPIAFGLLAGTILAAFTAIACYADDPPSTLKLPATGPANALTVASVVGCGTKPIGKIIVATLNRAPIVTLSANGHSVTLILDTGAERTVLTPAVAKRIGAQRPAIEFQRQLRGIAGDLATHEVELRSFAAGEVAIPWRRVLVAPVTMAKVFLTPLDGLLGADALSDFDLDLDLPRHEMIFYQKQFCPTAVPNWAGPYTAIDTDLSRGERLFFPVQFDGHRIIAVIDTGAQTTALSTARARALGLSEGLLARDRAVTTQGAAAELLTSRVHRFAKLEVGTVVVRNPEIIVTDLKLADADLVLGVDFLISRRLWLSYGSRRIFLANP